MKIVTIASGKGGSCKSTTTLCLAAILSEKHKVLVADTDPQGSLGWVADRSEAEFDVVSETNQKILARLHEIGGYDFLLCDTPPALSSEALEVTVKLSDFAVLPSPTSPLDIRELTRTIKEVIAPLGTPYRVLLTRVDSRRINEALTIQSQLMAAGVPTFNAIARNFVAHERSIVEGKLITQYKGSGAKDAADDYRRVASELLREMGV